MTERAAEYRVHKAPREGPARRLLEGAPRQSPAEEAVPGTSREDADGSPNYHIDLARPVPLEEVAAVVVLTLRHVHRAGHPGMLAYEARSTGGVSIRFPHLLIRRRGPSGY